MTSDGTVTLRQINDGIKTTLSAATGMSVSHSYNQLKEGIPPGDMPLLQVYFETLDYEPVTYQGEVQQLVMLFHADVFCRQRSKIGEDMGKVLEMADAVVDVLQTEKHPPFFNVHGVKDMRWRADRVTFDYAGALYAGIRFYITVYVF